MIRVVINKCYGGFGLSREANDLYAEKKGLSTGQWNGTWGFYENGAFYDRDIRRDDPVLVEVVEQLGDKANGFCAKLTIVEIPDGVNWRVEEYDGNEWIAESHRTWG